MNVEHFLRYLKADFYTGVPDSQLKSLCDYLIDKYGISDKHIIAANEGNAVAIAAGYYLATGKYPVVYMQNSGIGNIINPAVSLLHKKVYGIPCIYIIGWRGEPNIHDEPQHIFQGEITIKLLEGVGIRTKIIDDKISDDDLANSMNEFNKLLEAGVSVAFIIRKNALEYNKKGIYSNNYLLNREDAIRCIVDAAAEDVIISTTGKISRELFEIREQKGQNHNKDFLTVGSMGHSSSIALGIALQKKEQVIWCIDGDGAAIMHMGALAVIGSQVPNNFIHIVIDNGSHETVGGMPTVSMNIDWKKIASGCGYKNIISVSFLDELQAALSKVRLTKQLTFIVIKCSISSRKNLGRPTVSTKENKVGFMNYINLL